MITIKQIKAKLSYTPGKTWKIKKTYPDKSQKELYYKYLEDNRWKTRRKEILKRDEYQCQICGGIHKLNVHHKYYKTYQDGTICPPWYYNDGALITLCEDCHKKVHETIGVTYYIVPKNQPNRKPIVTATMTPRGGNVSHYRNASSKEMTVQHMMGDTSTQIKVYRKWPKYICLILIVVGVLLLC